uniref:Uncharacterized protein n=1 Tax=Plectus sambesii TaxID=2011161 RepID=A0A914VKD1_9BILA
MRRCHSSSELHQSCRPTGAQSPSALPSAPLRPGINEPRTSGQQRVRVVSPSASFGRGRVGGARRDRAQHWFTNASRRLSQRRQVGLHRSAAITLQPPTTPPSHSYNSSTAHNSSTRCHNSSTADSDD